MDLNHQKITKADIYLHRDHHRGGHHSVTAYSHDAYNGNSLHFIHRPRDGASTCFATGSILSS